MREIKTIQNLDDVEGLPEGTPILIVEPNTYCGRRFYGVLPALYLRKGTEGQIYIATKHCTKFAPTRDGGGWAIGISSCTQDPQGDGFHLVDNSTDYPTIGSPTEEHYWKLLHKHFSKEGA